MYVRLDLWMRDVSLVEIVPSLPEISFDRGCKAAQGIPRAGHLVNTTGKNITANDNSYALAA